MFVVFILGDIHGNVKQHFVGYNKGLNEDVSSGVQSSVVIVRYRGVVASVIKVKDKLIDMK